MKFRAGVFLNFVAVLAVVLNQVTRAVASPLPEIPNIVSGNASITQPDAGQLRIDQSSTNAIVNWTSFSIGTGNSVHFSNGSGATLNRVTGTDQSLLNGTLTGTGSVFLINQNGIIIGKNGVVETGGSFVASTLDIADSDFLNGGDNTFAGTSDASVINLGKVSSSGGNVAMIARSVINEGTVHAPNGAVGLVSGRELLLRDEALDDGKFLVKVGDAGSQIEEKGIISAASVELRAHGGNVYALAGNHDGSINATGATNHGGRIFLTAGEEGSVVTSKQLSAKRHVQRDSQTETNGGHILISAGFASIGGRVDADGEQGGTVSVDAGKVSVADRVSAQGLSENGGTISLNIEGDTLITNSAAFDVTGSLDGGTIKQTTGGTLTTSGSYLATGKNGLGGKVDIGGGASRLLSPVIEASGNTGGGRIRIGGEYQGGKSLAVDEVPNTSSLAVTDSTIIRADATGEHGHGGEVILWADNKAAILGQVTATPGSTSGDGGFIELSAGSDLQVLTSSVNASSSDKTRIGTILIDPRNIIIQDASKFDQSQFVIGNGYTASAGLNGTIAANDRFGASVSLRRNLLAVGAGGDDGAGNIADGAGAVYLYRFDDAQMSGGTLTGIVGRNYTGGDNINVSGLQNGDTFGRSVSLSHSSLAVGAPGDDGIGGATPDAGAVYLFNFTTDFLTGGSLVQKISTTNNPGIFDDAGSGGMAHNPGSGSNFGTSVSLSGNRLAVGAPGLGAGRAYVLDVGADRSNSKSVAVFSRGLAPVVRRFPGKVISVGGYYAHNLEGLDANDGFGTSVALYGDSLWVGAPNDDGRFDGTSNAGAVHVLQVSSDFETVETHGRVGLGYLGLADTHVRQLGQGDFFGASLSVDNGRVAIGVPGDDGAVGAVSNGGAVYLFDGVDQNGSVAGLKLRSVFGQDYTDVNPSGFASVDEEGIATSDSYGTSVALSGSRLVVGAPLDDGASNTQTNSGKVYLYNLSDGSAVQPYQIAEIGAGYSGGKNRSTGRLEAGDEYGSAVAMDQTRLAIGAPGDDGALEDQADAGAVYLYTFSDLQFSDLSFRSILGSGYSGGSNVNVANLQAGDRYGSSVAFDKEFLVVGAPGDDGASDATTNSGAVYTYRTDSTFTSFNNRGVLGAGYSAGSGFGVFSRSVNLDQGDQFGSAVAAVTGEDEYEFWVGAPQDDGRFNANVNSGSVYAFKRGRSSANAPGQRYIIGHNRRELLKGDFFLGTNVALDNGDQFGSALSVQGRYLAVGAVGDDGLNNQFSGAGAAYLFDRSSLTPTQEVKIGRGHEVNLPTLAAQDGFGRSIALNGNHLFVGAPGDDGAGNARANAGALYRVQLDQSELSRSSLSGLYGYGYTGRAEGGGRHTSINDLEAGDLFARAVAADGTRLAVGVAGDNAVNGGRVGAGSVKLFNLGKEGLDHAVVSSAVGNGYSSGISFNQTLDQGDWFGSAVSLSENRLVVGARLDDGFNDQSTNSGAVYLYTFSDNQFKGMQLEGVIGKGYSGGKNINVAELDAQDRFGASVSLRGSKLAVGASGDDGAANGRSASGAVYLFSFASSAFHNGVLRSKIGKGYSSGQNVDIALDPGDTFGTSVALGDSVLAVGSPGDDGKFNSSTTAEAGAVHFFSYSSGLFSDVSLAGTAGGQYAPTSITQKGINRPLAEGLNTSVDLDVNDRFGSSVSLYGNHLAVGALGDDGPANGQSSAGAVRVFSIPERLLGSLSVDAVFDAGSVPHLGAGDRFGSSVALGRNTLFAGAVGDDGRLNSFVDRGAVYRFDFNNNDYRDGTLAQIIGRDYIGYNAAGSQNKSLTGLSAGDRFGHALTLDGNRLVVGAPGGDGHSNSLGNSGDVYTFLLDRFGGTGAGLADGDSFADLPGIDVTLSTERLEALLRSGNNVQLQANNDIFLQDRVFIRNPGGNGGALTLLAGRSVFLNDSLITDNGDVTIIANSQHPQLVASQRGAGRASIRLRAGTTLGAGTGDVLFEANGGDIHLGSGSNIVAGRVDLRARNGSSGALERGANSQITVSQGGNAAIISADFIFGGVDQINTPNGRLLAYQKNPTINFGDTSPNQIYSQTRNTLAPGAIAGTADTYIAEAAPFTIITRPLLLETGPDGATSPVGSAPVDGLGIASEGSEGFVNFGGEDVFNEEDHFDGLLSQFALQPNPFPAPTRVVVAKRSARSAAHPDTPRSQVLFSEADLFNPVQQINNAGAHVERSSQSARAEGGQTFLELCAGADCLVIDERLVGSPANDNRNFDVIR
ncbi:filamentous hemagglutinin N-terminal domain-containing protein [Pyruvatibacter sp.]|uniref:two-partner secretion domain-containing protein n=1 Tax=Pyruvatibacter sp. TaxID=1981328 RepID=UPI003265DAE5